MVQPSPLPSFERLHELFSYCPKTGLLTRKKGGQGIKPGKPVGNADGGYLRVYFDGRKYHVHRIIWKMQTGDEPLVIDHVDRNGLNNAWENLRAADCRDNSANRVKRRGKYLLGARYTNRPGLKRPWWSMIARDYLGAFATEQEAHEAYVAEHIKRYGEFSPHVK